MHPKPLQRQSVPLVCNIFNDKTVAAFRALQGNFSFHEGTSLFISIITKWFKMMNVKDTTSHLKLKDDARLPWTLNCKSFSSLQKICEVVSSCKWTGGRGRKQKLTIHTAEAFITTTNYNIAASKYILTNYDFQYILPSVFSTDFLEKFFGQTRQRSGGNFYIDIKDVMCAAKVQRLHQLVKHDIIPVGAAGANCLTCNSTLDENDIELVNEFDVTETQSVINSDSTMKHKIIYIAGFLAYKHRYVDPDEAISSGFLDELNRGGLSIPTLSVVFFVHSAMLLHQNLPNCRKNCCTYFRKLLSCIDAPIAQNEKVCKTLTNVIFKAYVLNNSDREKQIGCLRRKEKLSSN